MMRWIHSGWQWVNQYQQRAPGRESSGTRFGVAATERMLLLERRFEALDVRQRTLIAAAGVTLVLLLWNQAVMRSLYSREKAARSVLELIALAPGSGNTATSDIETLFAKEQALSNQYFAVRRKLDERAASLIDPQRMPTLLTDLIAARAGLRLVHLANLPVTELAAPELPDSSAAATDTSGNSNDGGSGPAQVAVTAYVHGMEITVEGSFTSVHEYLQAIEQQRWHFLWRSLDLDASEYPKLRAKLSVATLSLEKHWLGI